MTTIAFAGLGSMGMPMAKNLLTHGFTLRGIDLNKDALETIHALGATPCQTAIDAVKDADVLIVMVVNASQAEKILFQDKVLEALNEKAIVCLMSTCSHESVVSIAQKVMETGRRFMDAPVSGGVVGAENASLTIMAAGDRDVFDDMEPIFNVLGQRIFHVGLSPGQGAIVKTVNQLLCGVHIAVTAEALTMASKAGIDLSIMLDILSQSAASSWMLKDRGPRMLQNDPEITSAVDIFVKDLGIVLETASQIRVGLPIASVAHQLFLAASSQGLAKEDDSQVIQAYRALNGITT